MKPAYHNHIIRRIALAFALSGSAGSLHAQGLALDYSGSRAVRSGDLERLEVRFSVAAGAERFPRQEAVYVFPAFVSADGRDSVALQPLCIAGGRRWKVIRRRKALHNYRPEHTGVGEILPARSMEDSSLTYVSTFPFERWMATGHIAVREKTYGCAECGVSEQSGTAARADIPLFGPKDYEYHFIEPHKVVSRRETSLDLRVVFPWDKHVLLPAFADNSRELDRLDRFVAENTHIPGCKLTKVALAGYASPEGSFLYNKTLASRRTHTIAAYIARKYPRLKQAASYTEEGVGEDWEGLEKAVASSNLPEKRRTLAIIGRAASDTERETAIRALDGGKTYARLLKEIYPWLRRTTVSLTFDVRPYSDDELAEIFDSKSGRLSSYEMYRLALAREARGEDPLPVWRKACEQFPADTAAALNYANALLKHAGDADEALRVLQKVKGDPRALLPEAIARDMKGEWREAERLRAAAAGK